MLDLGSSLLIVGTTLEFTRVHKNEHVFKRIIYVPSLFNLIRNMHTPCKTNATAYIERTYVTLLILPAW